MNNANSAFPCTNRKQKFPRSPRAHTSGSLFVVLISGIACFAWQLPRTIFSALPGTVAKATQTRGACPFPTACTVCSLLHCLCCSFLCSTCQHSKCTRRVVAACFVSHLSIKVEASLTQFLLGCDDIIDMYVCSSRSIFHQPWRIRSWPGRPTSDRPI